MHGLHKFYASLYIKQKKKNNLQPWKSAARLYAQPTQHKGRTFDITSDVEFILCVEQEDN